MNVSMNFYFCANLRKVMIMISTMDDFFFLKFLEFDFFLSEKKEKTKYQSVIFHTTKTKKQREE